MRIQPNRTKGDLILQVINYAIRIMIVLIGLFFLIGFKLDSKIDVSSFRLMGLVITLFGIYRLIMYYMSVKRQNFDLNNDKENE